jgi:Putative DNA-binding domain
MPSLAEFQRDFAAALLGPAAAGADEPAGLRIHRNTAMKGLVDAVIANYPTVGVLMGEQWLGGAAQDYAGQHPARQAVLADYGEAFPDFLRALDAAQDWPYLPDVAELDRAWTQALLAPDAPALRPAQLSALAPQTLAALQLRLHPSACHGVYAHSAVTVWQANRPPATPPAELHVAGIDEAALMLRNDDGVVLLPLDDGAHAFLHAITSGSNLTEAVSAALQTGADVAEIWSRLLTHGVFADIQDHGD